MKITRLRQAGADNLTDDDYREIFEELRTARSLRAMVEAAGGPEKRIAYWSRYARGEQSLDFQGRNDLRRLVGLPPLALEAGDVTALAADAAAEVWQVGDDAPAQRVLLLAVAGALTLHVNGNGPALLREPATRRARPQFWRPCLPAEWREQLAARGIDLRQIVHEALEGSAS